MIIPIISNKEIENEIACVMNVFEDDIKQCCMYHVKFILRNILDKEKYKYLSDDNVSSLIEWNELLQSKIAHVLIKLIHKNDKTYQKKLKSKYKLYKMKDYKATFNSIIKQKLTNQPIFINNGITNFRDIIMPNTQKEKLSYQMINHVKKFAACYLKNSKYNKQFIDYFSVKKFNDFVEHSKFITRIKDEQDIDTYLEQNIM